MMWSDYLSRFRTILGTVHGSRAFCGPYQVSLHLRAPCNVRCIHCYLYSHLVGRPNTREVRRGRRMGETTPADREVPGEAQDVPSVVNGELIDQLAALGTQRFVFTALGEPLLNSRFLDYVERVKRHERFVAVNTNGTLLDRARVDAMLGLRLDELRITTLAGSGELYAVTHPGSAPEVFERVRFGLAYLAERKREEGASRPRVSLCYVMLAQNCEGLQDFARFAVEAGADRVVFRALWDYDDPNLEGLTPDRRQVMRARLELSRLRPRLTGAGVAHNIDDFLNVFAGQLDTAGVFRAIPCYAGWLMCQVQSEGTVYGGCRCCEPMGNLRETAFTDVWNAEAYQEFRRAGLRLPHGGPPPPNCACHACANYEANLRVHRLLHPLASPLIGLRPATGSGQPVSTGQGRRSSKWVG